MIPKFTSNRFQTLLIFFFVLIGIGSWAYTQYLVINLRENERSSIQLWAKAIEYNGTPQHSDIQADLTVLRSNILQDSSISESSRRSWTRVIDRTMGELQNSALNFVANEFIIKNRFKIPSIVTDDDGNILFGRNLPARQINQARVNRFESENAPIRIVVGTPEISQVQRVYYGDSFTIRSLSYFPAIKLGFLALYIGLSYYS